MPNIIKSMSVVDSRPDGTHHLVAAVNDDTNIIKRQIVDAGRPVTIRKFPTKDSLLEEFNRLRVQIADAQKEMRSLESERKRILDEIEELEERRRTLQELQKVPAEDRALALLQQAEAEAAGILDNARQAAAQEAEQLKAKGYQEGLQTGVRDATDAYRSEHEPEIDRFRQMAEGLSGIRDSLIQENESEIIDLIMDIAGKVIGQSLEQKPERIADMLRDVVEQNRREAFVKITISQDLMPMEAKVSDKIRDTLEKMAAHTELQIDSHAAAGTIMVETPGGFTDLSLPTQLENLHEALTAE